MCLGETPRGNFIKGREKRGTCLGSGRGRRAVVGNSEVEGVGFLELTKGLRTGSV